MKRTRVVISGLGFVSPIGNSREEVVASLRAQRHGLEWVEWFPGGAGNVVGTIKEFETASTNRLLWKWPERHALPREVVRSLPAHGLFALCAIDQALAEARLEKAALCDGGTGLFCASAGSPRFLRHYTNELADTAGQRANPWSVVSSIAGTLNFNLAAHYGIRGAVTGFVSACAASTHALGYAHDEIALGRQRRMVVVGAEEPFWESLLPFSGMRALSRQKEPLHASRPFDAERDGFVGAGGAAALIVEAEEEARARGAAILAEIAGWGQSADGHSIAQSDPEGDGLLRAMQAALATAGVTPAELAYINAHATSTPVGDRAEACALLRLLGQARPPVSSLKGLTGHTLSMSGALETALCVAALVEGFVPGNAHLRRADEACADLNLPRENLPGAPELILKNSSGFGGSNVCLVLRRWREPQRPE